MRLSLVIISILGCVELFAQIKVSDYHFESYFDFNVDDSISSKVEFTSVKPYRNLDFIPDKKINFAPILDVGVGVDLSGSSKFVSQNNAGAKIFGKYKQVDYSLGYLGGFYMPLDYIKNNLDTLHVFQGQGYAHEINSNAYYSNQVIGHVRYQAPKYFAFELGRGKNFIGDGYRSLMLSDNASAYPYLRINTKVWRIKYTNLFSMMNDVQDSNGIMSNYKRKYSTTHFLDWQISKRTSVGIFETIVWQAKDTLLNRGFDVNYLNPLIFYRPVEYSLGSSDNAILGVNFKVKTTNKQSVYGQIVLDEFLLDEVKQDVKHVLRPNDTSVIWGWWANKYAFQLGYKAYDIASVSGLSAQVEFNFVRPFMYAHGSVTQNYGHLNQALAHPMGANFAEIVTHVFYQKDKFKYSLQLNYSEYGSDSSYVSYGGNIYQSYSNRDRTYYFQNGSGLKNNQVFLRLNTEYLILPKYNMVANVGYMLRYNVNELASTRSNYFYVSLKTNLFNRYLDY